MTLAALVDGGWKCVRERATELDGATAGELLRRTALLPGTQRLARVGGVAVECLGEVRDGDAPGPVEAWQVEAILDDAAPGWRPRGGGGGGGWVVREVAITPEEDDGGLRVEARLTAWDGPLPPACREALERFLCRAQAGLRFARCELGEGRAAAVARLAGAGAVEAGLAHAVRAVSAASAALGREAAALLTVPGLAEAYLRFFAPPGERAGGAGRI